MMQFKKFQLWPLHTTLRLKDLNQRTLAAVGSFDQVNLTRVTIITNISEKQKKNV